MKTDKVSNRIRIRLNKRPFGSLYPAGRFRPAERGFLWTSQHFQRRQRSPSDYPGIFQRRRPARQEPAARRLISP